MTTWACSVLLGVSERGLNGDEGLGAWGLAHGVTVGCVLCRWMLFGPQLSGS